MDGISAGKAFSLPRPSCAVFAKSVMEVTEMTLWDVSATAVVLLCVQLFVYGRIPGYKNNRRSTVDPEPPVSVVVPLFSEDYSFVEERLPLMLAQSYPDFEVVIVYVGHDSDFYEDLVRLKQSFPQIATTKIHLDPPFPDLAQDGAQRGIKSAHHECMVFTSTDACRRPTAGWRSWPRFTRGEIVVGYCGVERKKGFSNYMMRAWRMMHSVDWRAPCGADPTGARSRTSGSPSGYFGANGFSHLNMNIGEDDFFMSKVMTRDNVSVILSPRASLREKTMGRHGLVDEPAPSVFRLGHSAFIPCGVGTSSSGNWAAAFSSGWRRSSPWR